MYEPAHGVPDLWQDTWHKKSNKFLLKNTSKYSLKLSTVCLPWGFRLLAEKPINIVRICPSMA